MKARTASLHRKTTETDIRIRLNLDGQGKYCGFHGHPLS